MNNTLYTPELEHDSCGIGFIAHLKNKVSHKIITDALLMLENMKHRGGVGDEKKSGDGAGILIQLPHEFFKEEMKGQGINLPEYGNYGAGLLFMDKDIKVQEKCRQAIRENADSLGLKVLGYRKVPVCNDDLGRAALRTEPAMYHVFFTWKDARNKTPDDLERKLFILKISTFHVIRNSLNDTVFYWNSLSYKVLLYKGQFVADQIRNYFIDLKDKRLVSALALIHSRFSTNTFPNWRLAQPFRYIAHNGEINTIRGNVNWLIARESLLKTPHFTQDELHTIFPICSHDSSDSSNLDRVVEMLVLSGKSLPEVMMMLVPEAWDNNNLMEPSKKAFYEYFASIMEPWDGPASICFTDGKIVGATLDRNGLRPSRYCVTANDQLIMASESGVLPIDESEIIEKGRLQPGKIFIADLSKGRIISDKELKSEICTQHPYREWLNNNKVSLKDLIVPNQYKSQFFDTETLYTKQQLFGYTLEDLRSILIPMVETIKEPIGAMGTDTPLAVLSQKSLHFSHYFKQLFAQVSNPPIDSLREKLVMSLYMILGSSANILEQTPKHCKQITLQQPILTDKDLAKIEFIDDNFFKVKRIKVGFNPNGGEENLEKALNRINEESCQAVKAGYNILIISDKASGSTLAPIPTLLAVSSIHQYLTKNKIRTSTSLIVEGGDIWETHHFATLIGYGANAINPYLVFQTLRYLHEQNTFSDQVTDLQEVYRRYIKAIDYGLLKVMAKMGISTLQSYHGSQIFEILGLDKIVVEKSFTYSISRIGGLNFDDIAQEVLDKFYNAFPKQSFKEKTLDVGGIYQWKRQGEYHSYNPKTIHLLQKSTRNNDYNLYKQFAKCINDQDSLACTLRGLIDFKERTPIPLDEVEPIENILKRFATGAMSFGSISYEAHTTLAIAMNRIGAKSNSGEGGEDERRYKPLPNGDFLSSAIKQVASGRFGVTSFYLNNAIELQIKMAQGAKPGEGGQLPGHKVDDWIASVRCSTPGVGLISPPPHHDIYSIEDLAQLIYDLKNANPDARINVKLVAEAGVGTIAAGVAKAHSDVILISGHDGGTGASPISSTRHAGLPWELGLAETHQTLVMNNLRSRVTLQTDGQIKTGRDLAIATLLGAEEWGVATAALIVEGCIMMRKCHLNTCPVGIATQNPELRRLFTGKPEHVVNLFYFLAEDLREIMANLGFRTINEMVGQADILKIKPTMPANSKVTKLHLESLVTKVKSPSHVGLYKQQEQDHEIDDILDHKLINVAADALKFQKTIKAEFPILNRNRTTGAMLSSKVSRLYGKEGLAEDTINIKFRGVAGQSFAAFLAPGITFEIEGESNDYFGKGLSGGKLAIYPDRLSNFVAHENQIIGNVAFYGATSGKAYINGLAGERFCVRNSGVQAVVEGIGDHGCEYMTGGKVIILGKVGRNFAAGMSGGIAYIWDVSKTFRNFCTERKVDFDPLDFEDFTFIQQFIIEHLNHTNSKVAQYILDNWDKENNAQKANFIKVIPREYKKAIAANCKTKKYQTSETITN